jgi:hypothetical protein
MAVRFSTLRGGRPSPPTPQEDSWYSFLLEAESNPGSKCGWKDLSNEKPNDVIGNRTPDLPACCIMTQPTTLPRSFSVFVLLLKFWLGGFYDIIFLSVCLSPSPLIFSFSMRSVSYQRKVGYNMHTVKTAFTTALSSAHRSHIPIVFFF